MTKHQVYFGDSRHLGKIADKSVQLIITSPPYWQLKDYGSDQQIGFNDSYEAYINNLNTVWQECNRVLSDGCRLCINIGDQFARSVYYGRYKVIPIRTEIIRFCEHIGMDYMGAIIWQKTTTMNTSGGGAVMGSFPYPRNGILKIDYEFILIFKKPGSAPKPTFHQKEQSIMTREEWNEFFSSHWYFGGVRQMKHLAMFPEELPRRLIKMFSFSGETVFDPFLGSGTTALAAMKLGRNSIGYEINEDFSSIIREKLSSDQLRMDGSTICFDNDHSQQPIGYAHLPYIFIDPHKTNNRIDLKKVTFGSKIDKNTPSKETLFTIKEIISPNLIQLNTGQHVRLIGVKELPSHTNKAIEFLKTRCANKRVYLRYDTQKHDDENNLLCYVYLDNRTFINNHLIRTGYVAVDTSYSYMYINKFIQSSPLPAISNGAVS